jgi:hypothetical protein
MCKLIGHFAVFTMFAYATWSVVIFTLLLLNNTTSHAGKVSDERPAAQAEVTSDEPAQTPTPDPTPEGRFDRMYKLFHLGSSGRTFDLSAKNSQCQNRERNQRWEDDDPWSIVGIICHGVLFGFGMMVSTPMNIDSPRKDECQDRRAGSFWWRNPNGVPMLGRWR